MPGYTARTLLKTPKIREATLAELLKVSLIHSKLLKFHQYISTPGYSCRVQ